MYRIRVSALLLATVITLVGCGRDDLVGAYEDDLGMTRYEFHGKGQAHLTVLGATVVAEYHLDGDRVLVTGPQGTLVLTRRDDRLYGPMGMELKRQMP
ncbi:MAG: hypothetical protein EA417_07200 [Gammaproteobacteria bacterium]|nr:MAG: hypothetical protein EA417_07200 [Gammaproteobacteria bacterium]